MLSSIDKIIRNAPSLLFLHDRRHFDELRLGAYKHMDHKPLYR